MANGEEIDQIWAEKRIEALLKRNEEAYRNWQKALKEVQAACEDAIKTLNEIKGDK